MINDWSQKITGWCVLVASLVALVLVMWPGASRTYFDYHVIQSELALIKRHVEALSRQPKPNPNRHLQSYIWPMEDNTPSLISADVQASLLETLQLNQGRLVNLQQVDNMNNIIGLTGLDFRLSFEGDLQTLTGFLEAISSLEWPILIEGLDIIAQGPEERPDRNLRINLTLRLWLEDT